MNERELRKNRKHYTDLSALFTERIQKTISSYTEKDLNENEDYLLAVSLFLLYEQIYCRQVPDISKVQKSRLYNDDILFAYYNRYKPFFTGKQLCYFVPEEDMKHSASAVPMLRIFNTLAFELKEENPYAKTMLRQLFKFFFYELYINAEKVTSLNSVEELILYTKYIPNGPDDEGLSEEEESKLEMDKMCLVWLFMKVYDKEIRISNPAAYKALLIMAKINYQETLAFYASVTTPGYMETAPTRDEYVKQIESDNMFVLFRKISAIYQLDASRPSYGLLIYHRMKRFTKRVFYWNELDVEGDLLIAEDNRFTDMHNISQAFFFLKWMFAGDESKIKKELLEPAAAIMYILNGYMEFIHHSISNMETLVRVEDSASVARTYLESKNNGTDPRISEMQAELARKEAENDSLLRQVQQLTRENEQLTQAYQAEHEKYLALIKNEEDNKDWQQLEELYAKQVDKQTETISKLNTQIERLNEHLAFMQKENDNLSELNRSLISYDNEQKKQQKGSFLQYGTEKPFFENEIEETILEILYDYKKNYVPQGSRKAHIVEDILNANIYRGIIKERRKALKTLLKGDVLKNIYNSSVIRELEQMGFDYVSDNTHIKMTYGGDARYTITVPKTSSDGRAAENLYATIKNLCY